jgi:hypothetical protein
MAGLEGSRRVKDELAPYLVMHEVASANLLCQYCSYEWYGYLTASIDGSDPAANLIAMLCFCAQCIVIAGW